MVSMFIEVGGSVTRGIELDVPGMTEPGEF